MVWANMLFSLTFACPSNTTRYEERLRIASPVLLDYKIAN
jgi:hypothetical protein